MGERLGEFLSEDQKKALRDLGQQGDQWRQVLKEAGGDENLASLLLEIRGVSPEGTPPEERPVIKGASPRVAAQKAAFRRKG